MTAASPRPVADVDEELRRAIRAAYKDRWAIGLAAVSLLVGAVVFLGVLAGQQHAQIIQQHAQIVRQEKQLQSSCDFFRPLTPLPVTVPPGKKPPPLGVQIIAGARTAYAGQECGQLPSPSRSLVTWASYYDIPVAR